MSASGSDEGLRRDRADDLLDALLDGADLALEEKLAGTLDVEAGLASVMGSPAARTAPGPARRATAAPDGRALSLVAPLAPADRLALRTHPAVDLVWLARLCTANADATREIAQDLTVCRDAARTLRDALSWGHTRARDFFASKRLVHRHGTALARATTVVTELRTAMRAGPPPGHGVADLDEILDALAFALEFAQARVGVLAYAEKHARRLDRHLTRAHTDDDVRARARAYLHARFLVDDEALARAHAPTAVLDRALARIAAHRLDRHRGGPRVGALLSEALRGTPAEALAGTVLAVADDLDDFGGADLREADLAAVPLEGIRWTAATRWPDGWGDRIARRSARLDGPTGLYEIRSEDRRPAAQAATGSTGRRPRRRPRSAAAWSTGG